MVETFLLISVGFLLCREYFREECNCCRPSLKESSSCCKKCFDVNNQNLSKEIFILKYQLGFLKLKLRGK